MSQCSQRSSGSVIAATPCSTCAALGSTSGLDMPKTVGRTAGRGNA